MISKRGQVTIFIIIAIIIVALIIVLLYPRIRVYVSPTTPSGYIEDCVNKDIQPIIDKLSVQGGSFEPINFVSYQSNKVEYLCYTTEYYRTCIMQQPMLKKHIEEEIAKQIKSKAEKCVVDLAENYREKGYQVSTKKASVEVELIPRNIKIIINAPLTLEKEQTESYDKFSVLKKSEMYSFVTTAQAILNWEARVGDSNPESFMLFYPDLRIEKLKLGDGSKIYTLSNRDSGEKFIFASRSLSWPAGYGVQEPLIKT